MSGFLLFLGPSIEKVKNNLFAGSLGSSCLSAWTLWQSALHSSSDLVKDWYEGNAKTKRKEKQTVFPFLDDDDDHADGDGHAGDDDDMVINVGEDKEEGEGSNIANTAAVDN